MRKILIANRGEIAVRIARACRDAGLASVAVYAEPDLDGLHVRMADEAYTLGGQTPADSYLDIGRVLAVAERAGADVVHPGYGFLAENEQFARAVTDAGLTWIGPPPEAIVALGDKVAARRIARAVGAPLVAGSAEPVADAEAVLAFAREHGLPIAIKAAYGGGGRGLKVARTLAEIPDQFTSAVREAVAAFGRGECFVERYLDRPRHVETQCLADRYGTVVVVSTRDCTLQRRHQKLVEEAPAPFLTPAQTEQLYTASKAILARAGYVGAGTCEFLVSADGEISFLEVNTRLQVEHPVTEEVTRIDLVLEQLRIADGEPIGYADPVPRGHAIEFRVNAEDAGRDFLPAAGTLTRWHPPTGPGVRVDAGYLADMTVPAAFDSLLAKVIVTGADRPAALRRARRALAELDVAGVPTVLPFHLAVVDDPAFAPADPAAPFTVHTRWIETEYAGRLPPSTELPAEPSEAAPRERVTVEVDGRRIAVVLPVDFGRPRSRDGRSRPGRREASRSAGTAPGGDALVSPMQGTVVKVAATDGAQVEAGEILVVLEAMKMELPILAHKAGTLRGLTLAIGETVRAGTVIGQIAS